jgi:fibronectin-binding autotransporter adhesin
MKPTFKNHITAAIAGLLGLAISAQAATFNWEGDVSSDFQTVGNWVENSWAEWNDYRFGSAVTNGTVSYNSGFGTGRLFLDSGLTTDITIGGSSQILMSPIFVGGTGTITIASDSQNLIINNAYWSFGNTTWNVGAGRSLTLNNSLSDWAGAGGASLVKQGAGTAFLSSTSSYSGITILEGGILNVSNFSDYGVNGGLGNRSADGGGNVGILFRGGTLQYTGSTAQSTNRAIRLSTTGGGGTIDASGSIPSATLSFTATSSPDFFEAPGNRTLTLTGSNTGNNTFAMVIGEAGGTTSLIKSGAGTWVLTATNTYTGNTTVDEGTLSLGNGTNNSNLSDLATVSIASGATVNLNFSASNTDTVGKLIIDGETMSGGTYDSTHPIYGSYFTGTGSLLVVNQDGIWTSTASGNWSTSANWQSNTIASGADKTATFSAGTGIENITVTLDTSRQIGNLAFSNATYTLAGGNTLTLDSTTTPLISVASGLTATIGAKLASAVELTKSGAGTLRLSAQNDFSNAINVSQGTLELATAWTFGNNGGGTPIVPGLVTVESGATLRADNSVANQLNGLNLNDGTVEAVGVGNGDWGNFHLTGNVSATGTSNLNADIALRASNVDFFVDSGGTLNVGGVMHNGAYFGIYSGAPANVSKSGDGTMEFSAVNTYTGNTTIDAGALNVTNTGSLLFVPTTNGVTNSVATSGTGTLSFLGTVNLELGSAAAAGGNSWNLFNLTSFAGLTPAAVSSTLGSFTEAPAGTWELPVTGAKWVFTEADGKLAYVVTATDYETWGAPYGLAAGSEAGDLDNDGLANQKEYAFGLIPDSGASVNPISVPLDKATGKFRYTRRATPTSTGLAYTVWTSENLVTWTEDTGATSSQTVIGMIGEVETVEATLTGTLPLAQSKLFIQVRAN